MACRVKNILKEKLKKLDFYFINLIKLFYIILLKLFIGGYRQLKYSLIPEALSAYTFYVAFVGSFLLRFPSSRF